MTQSDTVLESPWGSFSVRMAGLDDLDQLARFSALTAEETEGTKYDPEPIKLALKKAMEDSSFGCMLIAENDEGAIGSCLLCGREFSEWRNGVFLLITGMYVLPEYRREGVRAFLYKYAHDWAREQPDVLGLRAYIHEDNDLDGIRGKGVEKVHNQPEFGISVPYVTPYNVIEVLFN